MKLSALRQRSRFQRYEADFLDCLGYFAQGDQSIANQAGAAFRSDLNTELQALVTLSSGSSAPATTYARQWWADTTLNVLKQRNAANSGWIIRGTLDETFVLSRSSNTILANSDQGKTVVATAAFTQTLTAAATLGDGWCVFFRNDAATDCTIDPNSTETINGATTILVPPGCGGWIMCNGSAFFMVMAAGVTKGDWTPADGSGATLTITINTTAKRVKLGSLVFAFFDITYPATADGSNAAINGLVDTAANLSSFPAVIGFQNVGSGFGARVGASSTSISFNVNGTVQTNANMSGKTIRGCAIYLAAA